MEKIWKEACGIAGIPKPVKLKKRQEAYKGLLELILEPEDHPFKLLNSHLHHMEGQGTITYSYKPDIQTCYNLSSAYPLRPQSIIFKDLPKPKFCEYLKEILPSWLKQGYKIGFTEFLLRPFRRDFNLDPSQNRIGIGNPDLLTNIDEVRDYCHEHNIEII